MVKSVVISSIGGDQFQRSKDVYTLDEAIEESKYGKCQIAIILLSGMAVMGCALENINISFIQIYIKCDLNLSTTEQGILSSISFLGIVFTIHWWGLLADRWGRQKVIRTAALGGFIFAVLSAFAVNTTILILLRFLAGALLAGSQAGAFSYVSEFHTTKRAKIATAMITAFISVVWIFMSTLAILLIPMDWVITISSLEFKPWRLFLICNSLVNLWNGIAFSFLPETPKFLLAKNRKSEALEVLSKIYALNTGNPAKEYPVKNIEYIPIGNNGGNIEKGVFGIMKYFWTQTKPIFQAPLFTHTWKLSLSIFTIFSIGHGSFMWFTDFMTQVANNHEMPKTLCEIVGKNVSTESIQNTCITIDNKDTKIFNMMFFVGAFNFVLCSIGLRFIAPKKQVCVWLMFSTIAGILMNYVTGFYPIFIDFVAFLSCCTVANVVMAVAVTLYPTQYRAMATSFIFMCGRLGGVAGSNIVGLLLHVNCELIFYLFSAVLIMSSVVFIMIQIDPDGKPKTKKTAPHTQL